MSVMSMNILCYGVFFAPSPGLPVVLRSQGRPPQPTPGHGVRTVNPGVKDPADSCEVDTEREQIGGLVGQFFRR